MIYSKEYLEDIEYIAELKIQWIKLKDKAILITGASGLIASCFIDVIMKKNDEGLNCHIYALSRSEDKIKKRFNNYWNNSCFTYIQGDINNSNNYLNKQIDYILHMASNTHPIAYATEPILTITTNVVGTKNVLDMAVNNKATRVLFASSNEIYGENKGDVEKFDEKYCGYIDCNTLRAGYPESKRCGEALCQAYRKQYGLDIVIARFTRTYGPTMLMDDSKASSQFIKNAIEGKDIVLKSEGKQFYSYMYVADSVSGLLYVLLLGEDGEAYNISDEKSDVLLRDFAEYVAESVGKKVIFDISDAVESEGFSVVTKARLNNTKLKQLGWESKYDIKSGIDRCVHNMLSNKVH